MTARRRMHLLQCVCHAVNPGLTAARRDRLKAHYGQLDANEFLEMLSMADASQLLPAWHLGLKHLALQQRVPVEIQDALAAAHQLNRARNQQLRVDAEKVAETLREIDCPCVFIMGIAHVLGDTYRDAGARMTAVIHAAVPSERLWGAVDHLLSSGFLTSQGCVSMPISDALGQQPPALIHEGMSSWVELHEQFGAGHGDFPSMRDVIQHSEVVAGTGCVRIPAAPHAAQIAILKTAQASAGAPLQYSHLRNMADLLFLIARNGVDLNDVQRAFQQARSLSALKWFASIVDRLFGTELGKAGIHIGPILWLRGHFALSKWLAGHAASSGRL